MKAQEVDISFQINIQRLDNERFICCHNEVSLATEQRKKNNNESVWTLQKNRVRVLKHRFELVVGILRFEFQIANMTQWLKRAQSFELIEEIFCRVSFTETKEICLKYNRFYFE